ncbi:protein-methionine-sulfoxide reductase heme-binding subunit MsrQ [Pusillimonas sp.]|uniref:sulfite oxidase heme-binding subunit YedZ n=1 Tax=Pusillimonas sp. TaxID=3040095 RepID=UPI0029B53ADD|nr:protein-methionine-sulfoxide reductase heme-binding subunit MsrQ [Pusillimonas sp.]MDX3893578.1 protein-methionine-sulfoxide reductase heme-binding subunit MsrQ [Pusillimonas sp.]
MGISDHRTEAGLPAGGRADRPGASGVGAAPRPRWTARQIAFFKPLLFIVCLYPVMRWLWLGFHDALTANPPEFLIRSSGIWALVALGLTLAVTPLRRYLGQPALLRCRRMLGLYTFFYSVLHVLGWAYWERGMSPAAMWDDILQRPFIAIGVLAVAPMLALALTSTRGWMSRLGARWHTLHRSIYAIAALSVWHFWLVRAGKNDFAEVYVYGAVLGVLLLTRLIPARLSDKS